MKDFKFFFTVCLEILPKFSDLVNFDYCIEKILSKSSDHNQFLFKKIFENNKKQIFSSEKMRNSGNCIHDYAHSFLGQDL